jgi:hypothetical protein
MIIRSLVVSFESKVLRPQRQNMKGKICLYGKSILKKSFIAKNPIKPWKELIHIGQFIRGFDQYSPSFKVIQSPGFSNK